MVRFFLMVSLLYSSHLIYQNSASTLDDVDWDSEIPRIVDQIDHHLELVESQSAPFLNRPQYSEVLSFKEYLRERRSSVSQRRLPTLIQESSRYPKQAQGDLLFVVHASASWDGLGFSRRFINQAIENARKRKATIVYLMNSFSLAAQVQWYTSERNPDFAFYSKGGRHDFPIQTDNVTVVGGYLGLCHAWAISDIMARHEGRGALSIHLPMKAIFYTNGNLYDLWVEEQLPIKDFAQRTLGDFFLYDDQYTIEFFFQNRFLGRQGQGKKIVRFKLLTDDSL